MSDKRLTKSVARLHFAEAIKPKLRQMPDEVTRLLADLVARRRQIVEMIEAGRFATKTAPRPASAYDSPWVQHTTCQIKS